MSAETVVELLSKALRVVKELERREIGSDTSGVGLLLSLLLGRFDSLGHLTLSGLGLLVDSHLMLELSNVGGLCKTRNDVSQHAI